MSISNGQGLLVDTAGRQDGSASSPVLPLPDRPIPPISADPLGNASGGIDVPDSIARDLREGSRRRRIGMTVGDRARRRTIDPSDDALWIGCVARAGRTSDPVRAIGYLMRYLEAFPTGAHNRPVAEAIEDGLDRLPEGPTKAELHRRFRALREEWMPPIVAVPLPIASGDRPSFLPSDS